MSTPPATVSSPTSPSPGETRRVFRTGAVGGLVREGRHESRHQRLRLVLLGHPAGEAFATDSAPAGSSGRSPTVSGARRRRSRRTSTIRRGRRRGRSRPAIRGCAVAAARTPSRATAKATPMRTARPATPARSSGAGPPNGYSPRCATGSAATGGCRRRSRWRAGLTRGSRRYRTRSVLPTAATSILTTPGGRCGAETRARTRASRARPTDQRESDLSIQRTGLRRWTRTGIEKESHHLHLPAASFVLALPQSLLDRSRVSQRRAQHPLLRRAGSRHRHSQTPRMDGGDRCTPGSAGLAEARARTTRALGGRGLVHAGDGASPVSVRNASARRLRGLRAGRSALPAGGAAECRRCRWRCTFRWLPSGSRSAMVPFAEWFGHRRELHDRRVARHRAADLNRFSVAQGLSMREQRTERTAVDKPHTHG